MLIATTAILIQVPCFNQVLDIYLTRNVSFDLGLVQ